MAVQNVIGDSFRGVFGWLCTMVVELDGKKGGGGGRNECGEDGEELLLI